MISAVPSPSMSAALMAVMARAELTWKSVSRASPRKRNTRPFSSPARSVSPSRQKLVTASDMAVSLTRSIPAVLRGGAQGAGRTEVPDSERDFTKEEPAGPGHLNETG